MKIVGSGLSGLIGQQVKGRLLQTSELVLLKRKESIGLAQSTVRQLFWDPPQLGDWAKEIDGAYAVINLAGEPIAEKKWTNAQKAALRNSRIDTTKALVGAIGQCKNKPKVFVNASAVGYYGPRDNSLLDEGSDPGAGFLAELCQAWEKEVVQAEVFGVRTVRVRTGIVLSRQGGALAKMLPPFRMFIGGPLGSGTQIMSWIHLEDEVNAILKALEDPTIRGAVNLTAPGAVTMNEFAKTMGRVLNKPSFFRVPPIALKVLLGEMSDMLLTGQNVYPKKLLDAGFKFKYPSLEPALKDLLCAPVVYHSLDNFKTKGSKDR